MHDLDKLKCKYVGINLVVVCIDLNSILLELGEMQKHAQLLNRGQEEM